jgi:glycosyltransferase involved in cell wall biosynthesis
MTISVLFPNYNNLPYLRSSIESILSQDYENFELIIMDDGSTDGSVEIIKQYAALDKRIRPFFNERMGLISQLNFGLDKAKFDLIARMDSDDISLPNRFSTQLNYMKDPALGLIGTGIYLTDEFGKFEKYGLYPYDSPINDRLLEGCFLAHPTVMFRSSIIQKIGGYSSKFLHAEDYELWLRMSRVTLLHNTKEKLLILRQHKKSVSLSQAPHQHMTDQIIKAIYSKNLSLDLRDIEYVNFEFIKKYISIDDYNKLKENWRNVISSLILINKIDKNQIPKYFLEHLYNE